MASSSSSSAPTTAGIEPLKFKTQFFGHLKIAGEIFENRIARPLLAFGREFRRPLSTDRNENLTSKKSIDNNVEINEPITNMSTLIETNNSNNSLISDHHKVCDIRDDNTVDNSTSSSTVNSVQTTAGNIFNSIIHTLSPKTNRRKSELLDKPRQTTCRSSSICTTARTERLNQYQRKSKCVSFAEDLDMNNDNIIDDHTKIIKSAHSIADKILNSSLDILTYTPSDVQQNNINQQSTSSSLSYLSSLPTTSNNDNDFSMSFLRSIRRPSLLENEELYFQDLSAEIVNYVLKHAIKVLKQEQLNLKNNQNNVENHSQFIISNIKSNEDDDDENELIDLK
ncbi:unnamed protein product [Didymodactylos carnosus]|uniref:Uncharacterized protein n=1 Tax=Didymodactylos carnosus TaxID=1234261 RepID=A0A813ZHJ0_9BILA|nr:unnamed protein product [Didymodactylos carnosus]CAF1186438.1 unnamed protein product [Didymodactylos carnosus]CAF3681660.1 unnamed protein product [Didymodactylos carnosus]CAF3997579.1 unnamed protein product [Didymodactylos carnosus]